MRAAKLPYLVEKNGGCLYEPILMPFEECLVKDARIYKFLQSIDESIILNLPHKRFRQFMGFMLEMSKGEYKLKTQQVIEAGKTKFDPASLMPR
jgi:hypothetical protein